MEVDEDEEPVIAVRVTKSQQHHPSLSIGGGFDWNFESQQFTLGSKTMADSEEEEEDGDEAEVLCQCAVPIFITVYLMWCRWCPTRVRDRREQLRKLRSSTYTRYTHKQLCLS